MTYVLFFYFYTLNNSCFLNVFVVLLYYITTKMKDITYSEMKRATMREGGGYGERGKACESGRLQVDVAAKVQSSERHPQDAVQLSYNIMPRMPFRGFNFGCNINLQSTTFARFSSFFITTPFPHRSSLLLSVSPNIPLK